MFVALLLSTNMLLPHKSPTHAHSSLCITNYYLQLLCLAAVLDLIPPSTQTTLPPLLI